MPTSCRKGTNMAVEYYKASKEIHKQVLDLVGKHHPDLALVSSEILVVFRSTATKAGGQVILGTSRKVPALMNAVADGDYKFILEIPADVWEDELDSKQQEALLDHLLCACLVEEDPKSGNTKFQVRKPDIMAFRDNVERYGMWFPKEDDDNEGGTDAVGEMFGEDGDKAEG